LRVRIPRSPTPAMADIAPHERRPKIAFAEVNDYQKAMP
jgi:hypothetical protein